MGKLIIVVVYLKTFVQHIAASLPSWTGSQMWTAAYWGRVWGQQAAGTPWRERWWRPGRERVWRHLHKFWETEEQVEESGVEILTGSNIYSWLTTTSGEGKRLGKGLLKQTHPYSNKTIHNTLHKQTKGQLQTCSSTLRSIFSSHSFF